MSKTAPPTVKVSVGPAVPIPTRLFVLSTYNVEPSTCRAEEKRLVLEAVVANEFVVVALVPVAFTKVKFCKVVEPTTNKSPEVLMVVVAEPPILKELPVKRLAKELVEVAEVVGDWLAMKPPVKGEEAVQGKPVKKPRGVEVEVP